MDYIDCYNSLLEYNKTHPIDDTLKKFGCEKCNNLYSCKHLEKTKAFNQYKNEHNIK